MGVLRGEHWEVGKQLGCCDIMVVSAALPPGWMRWG